VSPLSDLPSLVRAKPPDPEAVPEPCPGDRILGVRTTRDSATAVTGRGPGIGDRRRETGPMFDPLYTGCGTKPSQNEMLKDILARDTVDGLTLTFWTYVLGLYDIVGDIEPEERKRHRGVIFGSAVMNQRLRARQE
jgi:hypothetical protein